MTARRTLRIALFAVVAAALVVVPFALAGKGAGGTGKTGGGGGTGGGGYTISVSTPGPYTYGEAVYTTTTAPELAQSYIGMSCTQNGVLVMSGTHANWSGGWYFNYAWYLGPSQKWTGGAADCTATAFHLTNNKQVTDATTSFHVNG